MTRKETKDILSEEGWSTDFGPVLNNLESRVRNLLGIFRAHQTWPFRIALQDGAWPGELPRHHRRLPWQQRPHMAWQPQAGTTKGADLGHLFHPWSTEQLGSVHQHHGKTNSSARSVREHVSDAPCSGKLVRAANQCSEVVRPQAGKKEWAQQFVNFGCGTQVQTSSTGAKWHEQAEIWKQSWWKNLAWPPN